MRLYFIRHGESEANIQGVFSNRPPGHALTPAGIAQAEALAERLRGEGLTAIYSSPLLRAMQTASILGETASLPITVSDALREYDMGIYEGTDDRAGWEANHVLFMAWTACQRWDEAIEGGESLNEMRSRLEPFVKALLAGEVDPASAEPRLALVGHGGLYLALLPLLLDNVDYPWALSRPLGNTDMVVAERGEGGLTCLIWCGEQP